MSEVYRVWFRKAVDMKAGERIFLPVETKQEGQHIIAIMRREQEAYSNVNAAESASVNISVPTLRDGQLWVILRKMSYSPLVAYVKLDDETAPKKAILGTDEGRLRRIGARVRDGMVLREIEEVEGPVSEDERRYFGLEEEDEG